MRINSLVANKGVPRCGNGQGSRAHPVGEAGSTELLVPAFPSSALLSALLLRPIARAFLHQIHYRVIRQLTTNTPALLPGHLRSRKVSAWPSVLPEPKGDTWNPGLWVFRGLWTQLQMLVISNHL